MYQYTITKEFVNDNIRPFSGNDSLFQNCVREVIMLDLNCLDDDLTKELLNDNNTQEVQDLLNDNLRLSIAYFTYSRAIRTAESTVTKYGYTSKNSQDSYPADQEKIVSDSSYYKTIGERLLKIFLDNNPQCSKKSKNNNINDQYLKCRVIGC